MSDDMYFLPNGLGLRRGKRRSRRSPTDRPIRFWEMSYPELSYEGRIRNVSTSGMLIVAEYPCTVDTVLRLQLQYTPVSRDQAVKHVHGRVARICGDDDNKTWIGIELLGRELPSRTGAVPTGNVHRQSMYRLHQRQAALPERRRRNTRMYTLDVTLGGSASSGLGSWK